MEGFEEEILRDFQRQQEQLENRSRDSGQEVGPSEGGGHPPDGVPSEADAATVETLKTIYLNEKFSPEILEYQNMVDKFMELVNARERFIEEANAQSAHRE